MAHLKPAGANRPNRLVDACPVAAIALGSQRYMNALFLAEEAKVAAGKSDPTMRLAYELRADTIFALLFIRRDEAISTRATSADGALHQLAIANSLADELWELTPDQDQDSAAYFKAKDLIGKFKWAIYSVAGVLERTASAPRDQLGVEYYMNSGADPFEVTALGNGGEA